VIASLARVRGEWHARIAAEYTSAAFAHHLVLWLLQAGAPPDLLAAGLAIVGDELAHSQASHDVYAAAGGTEPPAIAREQLQLVRASDALEVDLLRATLRVFCLGETVAVPLFAHLRGGCTQPVARAALDRILVDEVRHRDFGWDALDWLIACGASPAAIAGELPAMLADLSASYGAANPVIAGDTGDVTAVERAWGLAPPREYADVLAACIDRDLRPRFAARDIALAT
jgi:hypothetical protein